jgi:hypothetical protein
MKRSIVCVLIAMLPACADVVDDEALGEDAEADVSPVVVGTLSATPDPLVFPKALVGQTVNAMVTVANAQTKNRKQLPQTIKTVSATAPFGVTAGGTCNTTKGGTVIGGGESCTLEFSFSPQKPSTVVKGTGTITFVSGTVLKFGLRGSGLELGVTAMPDPLVFPDATFGGTPCGSPGGTACTYGMITIHNNLPTAQTITSAFATAPFWVTWGGSCNSIALDKTIPAYGACELQWGFAPDAAGTDYGGKGTVSFKSGLNLSLGLEGSSTK